MAVIAMSGTVIPVATVARCAVVETARRLTLLPAVDLLGASLGFDLLGGGPAGLLGRARTDVLVHLNIHFGTRGRDASVTGPTATMRTNLRRDGLDCTRRAGDNGRYPAGPDDSQLLCL